jgi:hypothetical protein
MTNRYRRCASRWLRWGAVIAAVAALLACAPVAFARPQTIHGAAYEAMKKWMEKYDKAGFAKVVDFGDRTTYRVRLVQMEFKVDPNLEAIATYGPEPNTITFSKDPRRAKASEMDALGETAWHEVTHALEDQQGDDQTNPDKLFQDRNTWYMADVVRQAVPVLAEMEKNAKAGASVETLKAYWAKYLKKMEYAATKLDETKKFPPDLALMQKWFGFRANPDEVKALYLSGKAFSGKKWENLRLALQPPFKSEDWAGYWRSTGASDDNLTLTVSGASVAGVFAAPWRADYSDFQGTISADGGSMTGTWLYTPPGKPTPPVQVFAFTFFLNFNRYGDGLWRLQGYFTTPSAPGEQNWIGYFK